jgi:hypothetical protein
MRRMECWAIVFSTTPVTSTINGRKSVLDTCRAKLFNADSSMDGQTIIRRSGAHTDRRTPYARQFKS